MAPPRKDAHLFGRVVRRKHHTPTHRSGSPTPPASSVEHPPPPSPPSPSTLDAVTLILALTAGLLATHADPSLTVAFVYPAYASFKALQSRPRRTATGSNAATAAQGALSGLSGSDAEIERWLMYWAVVGVWAGVEGTVGWILTWLPFYTLCKTAVFAYFASGRGIAYVYHTILEPAFKEHEPAIDRFLANIKSSAGQGAKGGIGWIWEYIRNLLGLTEQQAQGLAQAAQARAAGSQPPTLADPASGAAQQAFGFLSSVASRYMPAALATVSAATSQAQAAVERSASSTPRGFDVPEGNSTAKATSLGYPYTLDTGERKLASSRNNSDDQLSGSGSSTAALSGFAEIRHEEAEGAPPVHPGAGARTASGGWLSWGGKEKAE